MVKLLKDFWCDEEGIGTIEIVLILIVILAMAILFRNKIKDFFGKLMDQLDTQTDDLSTF